MYSLPPLPYAVDALAPVIGATTIDTHHGKHHARYVEVTNELVGGHPPQSLEATIATAHENGHTKLFDNAAQAWNHAFYWESMAPTRTEPGAALGRALDGAFGTLDAFVDAFVAAGVDQFGSGWVWLLASGDGLRIETSHDAGQPWLAQPGTPLLVCDVWEHAYYLDYRQNRAEYLRAWTKQLASWQFADAQLEAALAGRSGYRYPV